MAAKSVQYFKDLFKTGYIITQQDYADWLDSFRSSLIGVPLSDTTGLDAILAAYRKTADKVPAGDIEGLTVFVNNLTTNFMTSASEIAQSQVTGLVEALSNCTSVETVQQMISDALVSVTPTIAGNGNWWVNGSDTGVKAQGDAGATPTINDAGNWEIAGADTGKKALYNRVIDYSADIVGVRKGEPGGVFKASKPFVDDSLAVYWDGQRMTRGNDKDFYVNDDQSITMNRIVAADNDLIFEYLPK